MSSLPADIAVLERGWLSSNSVLLLGDRHRGPVLIDTGYCTHADQTLALVRDAIRHEPQGLSLIVNTHLHSDHCGGNAALSAAFGCAIHVPPGQYDAARDWDESRLSYRQTGQQCPRFTPAAVIAPGEHIRHGGRRWQVHAAPGHDPHSILLFEPESAILISADALWEHGFGIVFPEIEGDAAFSEVEVTLDLIESLAPRLVIPGHGRPFTGVKAALAEARSRLAMFCRDPGRHARHAAKALIMFHLLELRSCSRETLLDWLGKTPVQELLRQRYFADIPASDWADGMLADLLRGGNIQLDAGGVVSVTVA